MSRSGYSDDIDNTWELIRYRGAVKSALRGKRGQAFLKELLADLDALPEKRLAPNEFQANGEMCTLGVIAKARDIDLSYITEDNYDFDVGTKVAKRLGISEAMAREIMYMNDEGYYGIETPEYRFNRMRNWVLGNIN
jgi:hypothetical protein